MKPSNISWQYNEFKQVGRDYGNQSEVDVYDTSHADFRDIKAESNRVLDLLAIKAGDTIIDFGSGTGTLAIEAAKRGARVHAVDISSAMLDRAKTKSTEAGVTSITFHQAGFLTYNHPDYSADAIVTTFAFHHLPDFWKGIALQRIHRMLKPSAQFYLHDVILEEKHSLENISSFIHQQEQAGGDFLREDAEGHFRDEYSTYDWVIEGLLARAGLSIIHRYFDGGVIGTYLCQKNDEA
ncbi:class I SAM-dependent methyltransferase [Synechococcus sp. PCC 6312]|uniref:class I SAM-dependent methyltransferase n=1 Tax=Synechococcus sp. (strain ATCC 27167 / PCC 6312) TaxID=195253 RepID=UPI00029EE7CE|nr:class I SAM-dependent methyltransferase [Synechococcus sp. PCC 6312]AFY60813.1 methylase involved in ubiquinone/menaquinone biosynthesis [Synechococcus sp. PCC 6312]